MVGVKDDESRLASGLVPLGKGWVLTSTRKEERMEAKDYLRMKVGTLLRTRAYNITRGIESALCTIVHFHAPQFISVLMHQGLYKNKIVTLRGFDFNETEIADVDDENIERLTNTTHMVDEIPLESCVT